MGCATSKPTPLSPHPPRPAPPSTKSPPSSQGPPSFAPSSYAPSSQSGTRSPRPAMPQKLPYDTLSSASLVEASAGGVAYHGLLVNTGTLNLTRAPALGAHKLFAKAPHPSHDSNPAATPSASSCTRVTGVAMTMPYTIIVGKPDCHRSVDDIAGAVFDYANDFLNAWNPESEIALLNRAKPGKTVPLSPDLAKLLAVVDDIHELTDGRFDPTTGVLTVAFENCIAENGRPPLPAELMPFKHAIGWKRRVHRAKASISRSNAHTVIDLDGVSKGYVVDLVLQALVRQGFCDCYVDWAGDIRAAGKHPSGRPWRSAVMKPPALPRVFGHWKDGTLKHMLNEDDIGFFANFAFPGDSEEGEVQDVAIATSGDYFAVQKYGYHHIARVDTMTVMKANRNSVGTVCVAAKKCAVADALATAAMTADNLDQAISFLKDICKHRSDLVYGFCVLGRKDPLDDVREAYTERIFDPLFKRESTSPSGSSSASNEGMGETGAKHTDTIHHTIIRNRYQYMFNGKSIELDNFVPCSMEPEQIVSFVTRKECVVDASLTPETELNKFSCKVLSPFSQSEPSKSRDTGIKVDMRFKHISILDESALVVAVIDAISLGSAEAVEAVYRNSFMPRREIWLGVPRSKLPFLPLVEQAKILFRQIPSMMWVVATTPPHGVDVAFTATSVSAPAASPNVLCFNLSHSSAFFAAFGGIGSTIRAHALSTRQKDIAEFYVKNSSRDNEDRVSLDADAMVTARCTVEHVDSFQDHLIVLARIGKVNASDEFGLEPLVWQNGAFLN